MARFSLPLKAFRGLTPTAHPMSPFGLKKTWHQTGNILLKVLLRSSRRACELQLGVAKAESVGDYRDGAEAHGGGGDDWAQEQTEFRVKDAGGDGDSDGVVDKSEEEVLLDVAHDCFAEAARADQGSEVAFQQGDAGALHGDVGSGSHGNANLGLGECGGVVDTVASHRDGPSLLLQLLDAVSFVVRQDAGFEIGDAELVRDGGRRDLAVPRQHDDTHALVF